MPYHHQVTKLGVREYMTDIFVSKAEYLPTDIYEVMLRNVIIFCVDCILLNESEMMIAKRRIHPHPDWWHIGGRMRPGESFIQAINRNIGRETGLVLPSVRFVPLNIYNLLWPTSREGVTDQGVHDVSMTFVARVNNDERAQVRLNPEEFEEGPVWIKPNELVARADDFHPALVQMAQDVMELVRL